MGMGLRHATGAQLQVSRHSRSRAEGARRRLVLLGLRLDVRQSSTRAATSSCPAPSRQLAEPPQPEAAVAARHRRAVRPRHSACARTSVGLFGEFKISKTSRGHDAYQLLKDGAIDSHVDRLHPRGPGVRREDGHTPAQGRRPARDLAGQHPHERGGLITAVKAATRRAGA